MQKKKEDKPGFFTRMYQKVVACYDYFNQGVWKETRNTFKVRIVKTMSLSLQTFTDSSLQTKSMSLTYSTVLALVPGFAMILAIGRGFGLQNIITDALISAFPAQQKAISAVLSFVDSYLSEASKGVFVGIGIVFLLWTLVSLLSSIENAFNNIWNIRNGRSLYQKITDYISICLLIPILMICSVGVSVFVSTALQEHLNLPFLTPLINVCLELSPLIFAWLAFTLSFYLIPNTKVSFKYAAISGIVCAIGYQIVQLLFVNGQIYVSKYNAIYGSFSFLPLMLIWLQLSWLILLFGCVLTYSMQNIFAYNYLTNINNISYGYIRKITLFIAAVIFQRFKNDKKPITQNEISEKYNLPILLINKIAYQLETNGLIYAVSLPNDSTGLTPAKDFHSFSVGELFSVLDQAGDKDFIPNFNKTYHDYVKHFDEITSNLYSGLDSTLVADIKVPS